MRVSSSMEQASAPTAETPLQPLQQALSDAMSKDLFVRSGPSISSAVLDPTVMDDIR